MVVLNFLNTELHELGLLLHFLIIVLLTSVAPQIRRQNLIIFFTDHNAKCVMLYLSSILLLILDDINYIVKDGYTLRYRWKVLESLIFN